MPAGAISIVPTRIANRSRAFDHGETRSIAASASRRTEDDTTLAVAVESSDHPATQRLPQILTLHSWADARVRDEPRRPLRLANTTPTWASISAHCSLASWSYAESSPSGRRMFAPSLWPRLARAGAHRCRALKQILIYTRHGDYSARSWVVRAAVWPARRGHVTARGVCW